MVHNSPKLISSQNHGSRASLGPFFFLLCLVVWSLSFFVLEPQRKRPPAVYLAPPAIQHFAFGAREMMADVFWIRSMQDIDYCEKEVRAKVCVSEGWLFKMLDLVTDLAPRFRMPYAIGGLVLTVIVNDFEGASRLFDKALVAFPDDLPILGRAAYHYLYEEHNNQKAARTLVHAAELGGPYWYRTLAERILLKNGDLELAERTLNDYKKDPHADPRVIETMEQRLEKYRQEAAKSTN